MLPLYASDLFGEKSFAKVLGIFVSVNVAGYALGAPLLNLCYDVLGTYVPSLVAVGLIMSVVFVLLQFVITAAHKEQARIEGKSATISGAQSDEALPTAKKST